MAHPLYESLRFSPSTRAKHHFVRNACLTSDFMIVPGQTPKSQGHTHAGSLQVRFPRLRRDAQLSPQPTPQRHCRTKLLNLQKKQTRGHLYTNIATRLFFAVFSLFMPRNRFETAAGQPLPIVSRIRYIGSQDDVAIMQHRNQLTDVFETSVGEDAKKFGGSPSTCRSGQVPKKRLHKLA